MAGIQGSQTTITFGTSGYTADYRGIDLPDQSRDSLDASTLASVDYMDFVPASLVDGGEVTLNFLTQIGQTVAPPIKGATEEVTIAHVASGKKIVFSAFVTSFNGGTLGINELAEGSIGLKITGEPVESAIS